MIISPINWQGELTTLCEKLEKSFGQNKDDFCDFEFEKSLYYMTISLRKLHDTLRPNDFDFYGWQFKGNYYSPRETTPSAPWRFMVDVDFDMTKPRQGNASFRDIIDMIMHSKYVDCSYSSKAIIVGSDRLDSDKSNYVFEFALDQFLRCCEKISSTQFLSVPPHRNSRKGVKR